MEWQHFLKHDKQADFINISIEIFTKNLDLLQRKILYDAINITPKLQLATNSIQNISDQIDDKNETNALLFHYVIHENS